MLNRSLLLPALALMAFGTPSAITCESPMLRRYFGDKRGPTRAPRAGDKLRRMASEGRLGVTNP